MKKISAFIILLMTSLFCNSQVVTTFAGFGNSDFNGSITGIQSRFDSPYAAAADVNGNLYIADTNNHRIRKVTTTGFVTTIAGSSQGFANGNGTSSQFNNPKGIVLDVNGNIYVADTGNHRIRKITTTGVVTTFAGSVQGFADGTGTAAQFSDPIGLVFDSTGNLFVVDNTTHNIRKITTAGVVTTYAGGYTTGTADGIITTARFNYPTGIAIDLANNLYIADSSNHRIRRISSAGIVTTFAGFSQGSNNGTGTSAQFNEPTGIVIDNVGNIVVADKGNHKIRKITPTGEVTTLAGGYTNGNIDGNSLGTEAYFFLPTGVTKDSNGNIFVVDGGNNLIRKINSSGVVRRYAGDSSGNVDGVAILTGFSYCEGIATDSNGNVYVSELAGRRIRKINTDGITTTIAGSNMTDFGNIDGLGISARFYSPEGIAVDGSGNIYVADRSNHNIRKISSTGIVSTLAGSSQGYANGTGTAAKFSAPWDVAVDASGNVFVADTGNDAIRKITPAGIVTTIAGAGGQSYLDGTGTGAGFSYPIGITIATNGDLYVTDSNNHKIRKVTQSGIVTTIAGYNNGPGVSGYVDGTGTAARFLNPLGIEIDSAGNLYVTDNYTIIRKITPAGVVTTFAGSTTLGIADGVGTSAQFLDPKGLTIDSNGNLYVAEGIPGRIRKITQGTLGNDDILLQKSTFRLYPNPTHDLLHIKFDSFSNQAQIMITDIIGKVIFSKNGITNDTVISMGKFSKGIYFMTLLDENMKETQKFIVD